MDFKKCEESEWKKLLESESHIYISSTISFITECECNELVESMTYLPKMEKNKMNNILWTDRNDKSE